MAATCTISGTILNADGSPVKGAAISARVESTAEDLGGQLASGAGITSDVVEAFSGESGEYEITLVQGVTALVEIAAINLRKKVLVPGDATAKLEDLI